MSTDDDHTGPARTGSDVRPAVTKDIARALRDGQSPGRIIQIAVDSLHEHYPHLRSAYSTLAPDGRVAVDRSTGPAWSASVGELVLPSSLMETLRTHGLIVINDTATDIETDTQAPRGLTSAALSAGLAALNIRALLEAPVHRSDRLVGLLSLDAPIPRHWSKDERATLRDAANLLGVAFRDADARRQLEDSELKFRLLAESSHAMIALLQEEGAVYLNPELIQLSGYSHDELMWRSLWDLLHPDDRDKIRSYRGRRLRDQTAPESYETRIVTKAGETRWLDIRASTFELGGKQTILVTGLDITTRKRAEQDLSESEARLRTLMEHLVDGVGLLVDGTVVFANPAMGRLVGYTLDELVGRSLTEFLTPGDRQRAMERIGALADGVPRDAAEYQLVRRDGTTVPVLVNSVWIEYDGRPALLSIHRDLTEQRELEEQLRQTQRLESVGQLAGGVAHNFNNALTAIIGYSELIARRLDADDPVLADVKLILKVAERSAEMTRQLLTFSRKEQIRPAVFDLNEAIESSRLFLEPLLDDHVQLQVRLDRSVRRVWADRRQLEQVVTNLVLNARDAMPDGGSLTIVTTELVVTEALVRTYPDARCGSFARLTVTDTGMGMERAIVAHIFEPFLTTKQPGQGVGLGLSMVHGAVKQIGGFVTVDSTPGHGTTFGLYLPVHEEPEDEGPTAG